MAVALNRFHPLRRLRLPPWSRQQPSWAQAEPALIDAALQRAQARLGGNWYVIGASDQLRRDRPMGRTVAGVELVAWRDSGGGAHVGPGACPHLGAPLCRAAMADGRLLCRWHGMVLDERPRRGWTPYPAYDDGVLLWVRLDEVGGERPTAAPVLPARPPPARGVAAVTTLLGRCEPADVVANRLDPWHGSWFHPYSFARLRVRSAPGPEATEDEDRFVVEVAYRVAGSLGVPVVAEFSCPDPRTVVMRIVQGDGAGSVVETHATPLEADRDGTPRTAVVEATIAYSDRAGFAVARVAAPVLRPLIRRAATRLWRDDLAYAERRYALRTDGRGR